MKKIFLLIGFIFLLSDLTFAQVDRLGVMQTANTLGKGGYATAIGVIQFSQSARSENRMPITLGNFETEHQIGIDAEGQLIPVRLTFGLGDRFDLTLGGTIASGEVQKTVFDFYNSGDDLKDRRVYDQPLFDGIIGMKFNIKPDHGDGFPAISIGGEVQNGYTVDTDLSDSTPADGRSFFGATAFISTSFAFTSDLRVHATTGTHFLKDLSFFWQIGGEFAVSEKLWFVGDFSNGTMINGLEFDRPISVGIRYDLSDRASLIIAPIASPGFQFNLTFGGEKDRLVTPPKQQNGSDIELPF